MKSRRRKVIHGLQSWRAYRSPERIGMVCGEPECPKLTHSQPRQAGPSATSANAPSNTTSRQVRGMRSLSFDVGGQITFPHFLIIGDELPELRGRCWKRGSTEVGPPNLQAPC